MCTSLISNRNRTIAGFNLDARDLEYRVRAAKEGVYIEIHDAKEGWMPLFGANDRGDFVGMPTCWPTDSRSDPEESGENIILLDIDLLMKKRTLEELRTVAERKKIYSIPGLTFMSQLSDQNGNVLQIVPGQGYRYFERPEHMVLTNFSPFKGNSGVHPLMGYDRYLKAEELLGNVPDDFGVKDCFDVLRRVSQTVCPTRVSMVFDVTDRKVFWCEEQLWDEIRTVDL